MKFQALTFSRLHSWDKHRTIKDEVNSRGLQIVDLPAVCPGEHGWEAVRCVGWRHVRAKVHDWLDTAPGCEWGRPQPWSVAIDLVGEVIWRELAAHSGDAQHSVPSLPRYDDLSSDAVHTPKNKTIRFSKNFLHSVYEHNFKLLAWRTLFKSYFSHNGPARKRTLHAWWLYKKNPKYTPN